MLGGHVRLRQTDRAFPLAEVTFLTVTACPTCEYIPASTNCMFAELIKDGHVHGNPRSHLSFLGWAERARQSVCGRQLRKKCLPTSCGTLWVLDDERNGDWPETARVGGSASGVNKASESVYGTHGRR